MSLVVWLPLNKSINNQGGSNTNFSILSTNTTPNASGKIGGCYGNNSNSAGGLCSTSTVNLGQKQSMCCWFKFTSLMSSSSLGGSLVNQHRYPNNTGMGLTLKYVSSSTGYLSVNTGNGSSRTFNTYCGTTLLQANTWYHGGFTYDNGTLKIYVNGTCEYTGSIGTQSVPADYITIFCWSMNATSGNEVHGNYKLNGYLNDVRVYDHCLSADEMKEVSRGLMCHYQMKKPMMNYTLHYDKNIYTEPDGSVWARIAHHNNPAGGVFASGDTFTTGVYKDANRWYDVETILSEMSLSTYEFMVKQAVTSGGTQVKYRWRQSANPLTATFAQTTPSSVTRITTTGYTDAGTTYGGGIYILNSNTRMCINNNTSGNWWGATGAYTAYQGGIPGAGGQVVTSGYMDLYIKLSDGSETEGDCSGMGNFAKWINIGQDYNIDSVKYKGCAYFNGTTDGLLIENFNCGAVLNSTCTIAFWIKSVGENSARSVYFGSYSQTSWSIEKTASNLIRGYWNGSPDVNYSGTTVTDGDWHHVCIVKNGTSDIKVYIDGALKGSTTSAHNALTFPTTFRIGRDTRSSDGTPYCGYMCDFRIYSTVFTAADVALLYNQQIV